MVSRYLIVRIRSCAKLCGEKTLRRKVVKAGIEPGLMVSSLLAVGISKKYQQE